MVRWPYLSCVTPVSEQMCAVFRTYPDNVSQRSEICLGRSYSQIQKDPTPSKISSSEPGKKCRVDPSFFDCVTKEANEQRAQHTTTTTQYPLGNTHTHRCTTSTCTRTLACTYSPSNKLQVTIYRLSYRQSTQSRVGDTYIMGESIRQVGSLNDLTGSSQLAS